MFPKQEYGGDIARKTWNQIEVVDITYTNAYRKGQSTIPTPRFILHFITNKAIIGILVWQNFF